MAQQLYGGAMACSIPERFQDVSEFRQVPDHQEVFADPKTDQSIIIEILEYENDVKDPDAVEHFFQEIAVVNESNSDQTSLLSSEKLDATQMPHFSSYPKEAIIGIQQVAKFKENDTAKNKIIIYLCNVRLPDVKSDIVISYNVPVEVSPSSSSNGVFTSGNDEIEGAEVFRELVHSLRVNDWSLFG